MLSSSLNSRRMYNYFFVSGACWDEEDERSTKRCSTIFEDDEQGIHETTLHQGLFHSSILFLFSQTLSPVVWFLSVSYPHHATHTLAGIEQGPSHCCNQVQAFGLLPLWHHLPCLPNVYKASQMALHSVLLLCVVLSPSEQQLLLLPYSTMLQSSETPNNIFKDTAIYIVSSGIGQMRLALFEKQIKTNGGKVLPKFNQHLTHIILEENIFLDRKKCINLLNKIGYLFSSEIKIVGTSWLSECLSQNKMIDSKEFEFILDSRQHNLNERVHPCYSSNNKSESEFKEDDKPSGMAPSRGVDNSPPKRLKVNETGVSELPAKFICALSSCQTTAPCNELIITELQKLADAFRSCGDHWRTHGYEKAISAIRTYGKAITSFQEVHALPGVGAKMAAKVQEIIDCGQLRKVQEICESEKTSVLEIFTKVWGAGPSTAESWYQQGFRTLDDLRKRAHLTQQQKIGLKHFEDIQERIPCEEVEQIGLFPFEARMRKEAVVSGPLCLVRPRSFPPPVTVCLVGAVQDEDDLIGYL
uniref:DNA polymerase n=1 Tax=Timema cristinae TaxID=61476 RepID=A0A7R9DFR5_TIMCR|nr:unnamed protein product [Timema cristinae]